MPEKGVLETETYDHSHRQPEGRVGKTMTTVNLGIGLAQEGKRVLLIDLNPQASMTISLGCQKPDNMPLKLSDLMGRALTDQPIETASILIILGL